MGMDLHGKQGYFRWTNAAWQEVLNLALRHGWEPEGTQPGRDAVRQYRSALRRAGKRPEQVERAVRRMRANFPCRTLGSSEAGISAFTDDRTWAPIRSNRAFSSENESRHEAHAARCPCTSAGNRSSRMAASLNVSR